MRTKAPTPPVWMGVGAIRIRNGLDWSGGVDAILVRIEDGWQ